VREKIYGLFSSKEKIFKIAIGTILFTNFITFVVFPYTAVIPIFSLFFLFNPLEIIEDSELTITIQLALSGVTTILWFLLPSTLSIFLPIKKIYRILVSLALAILNFFILPLLGILIACIIFGNCVAA
jgi:hypothetical protein